MVGLIRKISPERPWLLEWAIRKNETWGRIAKPIAIAYNKRLVPAKEVPGTHAAFERRFLANWRAALAARQAALKHATETGRTAGRPT